ncbi:MAG: hypothetical protein ACYDC1_06115, partial [Limisphaerales bacterium]
MKSRYAPNSERGVALVITLVMLSVVTLMAITFLAVSRRDRAAVAVTEEQTTARLMAQSALARANAEIVGQMMSHRSLLEGDFAVSTNLIDPAGFNRTQPVLSINYDYDRSGAPLNDVDRAIVIGSLLYNPRAPVYVSTNSDPRMPLDARFFLDLNRNGRFETNGIRPVMSPNNRFLTTNGFETSDLLEAWTNFFVGDPEWIGVTARAHEPHSSTNRFIGRYAYLVVPEGRTLDWNYIHNNARNRAFDAGNPMGAQNLGYYRNHGAGSWELNLAAFLYDLHPDVTPSFSYAGLGVPFASAAGAQAAQFLQFRYARDYSTNSLAPASRWFMNGAEERESVMQRNGLDEYADGMSLSGLWTPFPDNDLASRPWPGSDNTHRYHQLNELFDPNKVPLDWLAGMTAVQRRASSFDRYTLYRLLGQMGTDSAPAHDGQVHLNYDNRLDLRPDGVGYHATNLVAWTPLAFFTNAAERMLAASTVEYYTLRGTNVFTNYVVGDTRVRPGFSVTNIMVYPTNEYSATVHRLLQVALNLYDASTNRGTVYPYLPTVMQPLLGVVGTNVYITGYTEVTNVTFLSGLLPLDLNLAADRTTLATRPQSVVYNVPFLVGAKKGYPNFNEFSLVNVAQITRKAEVRKRLESDLRPSQTNLMYLLTVSNRFGLECWNSYTQAFARPLRMQMLGRLSVTLTNYATPGNLLRTTVFPYGTNWLIAANTWQGRQFIVPLLTNYIVALDEAYLPVPRPRLVPGGSNVAFVPNLNFYSPEIALLVTNRFYYALIDEQQGRLVDFVCLGNMATDLDISHELGGRDQLEALGGTPTEPANVWLTNRAGGAIAFTVPTLGVQNQMEIALGNVTVSAQQWDSYNLQRGVEDKDKSIDRFRIFNGLSPLVYTDSAAQNQLRSDLRGKFAMQVPYSPTRKLYQEVSWQANDPLVHYTAQDLMDPFNRPTDPNRTNAVRFAIPPQRAITNSNIGLVNTRYRPWGGNVNQSADRLARDLRVKDPMIERSDDWAFTPMDDPEIRSNPQGRDVRLNPYANVGWIGRVHRGTPWQTFYLKSGVVRTNEWIRWAGAYGTHPTNDWDLVGLFTTALNDNASKGVLSVNQTNLAAWSAVLAGVSVL